VGTVAVTAGRQLGRSGLGAGLVKGPGRDVTGNGLFPVTSLTGHVVELAIFDAEDERFTS
jgi:hypothetical protein